MDPYISSIFREPEVLRTSSFRVNIDDIGTGEIQNLIKTLVDECMKKQYLGFSPQNFAGLDIYPKIILGTKVDKNFERTSNTPTVIINPRMVSSRGVFLRTDGCAGINMFEGNSQDGSIIGMWVEKKRPDDITFSGFDINGEPIQECFSGIQAHALHHELEHTEGILMTDGHRGNFILFKHGEKYYLNLKKNIPSEMLDGTEIQFDNIMRLFDSQKPVDITNLVVPTVNGDVSVELGMPN